VYSARKERGSAVKYYSEGGYSRHRRGKRMPKSQTAIWRQLMGKQPAWMIASLVLSVVALILFGLGLPPLAVFGVCCLGLIPLAGLMGRATEELADQAGPRVGGLLNATLGNAAELIITLAAVRAGLLELVKASITGSIIGNLLLVLGFSLLVGGLRNGVQRFSREHTGRYATLLTLAVLALVIPSVFGRALGGAADPRVETLSLGAALMMIVIYGLGLFYSMRVSQGFLPPPAEDGSKRPASRVGWSLARLALATLGVVALSEILVQTIEPLVRAGGVTEFFLGIILVPIIGNVAEHLTAVDVARRNRVELSLEISLGSSLQIALLVAPLLVFISPLLGHPLSLEFNIFELLALLASVGVTALISGDGESNWLEGSVLLALYAILALGFWLLPIGG
jgi:Ca2+:H+ antiporter